jgi:Ras homolog enriched in brain
MAATTASRRAKKRKLVVMGYRGVGKSCITIRFVEDHFAEVYHPTIENTFRKTVRMRGEEFTVDIVDTAGMDEHSLFMSQYGVGIHGYVLVYSVASRQSLDQIEILNDKILHASGSEQVPRILVGNKSDLSIDRRITADTGKSMAAKLGCPFVECSAKHNDNIDVVFLTLLQHIEEQQAPPPEDNDTCILL